MLHSNHSSSKPPSPPPSLISLPPFPSPSSHPPVLPDSLLPPPSPHPLLLPPLLTPSSPFSPPFPSTTHPLLDRLTLHNDGHSGGGSIVTIILNSTGVMSAGAAQDVSKLQHECQVHSAIYYRPICCPPVELFHRI